jgi:hypothetical protein
MQGYTVASIAHAHADLRQPCYADAEKELHPLTDSITLRKQTQFDLFYEIFCA